MVAADSEEASDVQPIAIYSERDLAREVAALDRRAEARRQREAKHALRARQRHERELHEREARELTLLEQARRRQRELVEARHIRAEFFRFAQLEGSSGQTEIEIAQRYGLDGWALEWLGHD